MLADNPYIVCVDYFKNTKEFSYLAEQYNRTGLYTSTIPGTIEYLEFWQDVRDKCLNGFVNSCNQKITGQHFFYLNFCPILGLNEKTGKKSKIFPRFIDLDYEFFHMVEYCRLNQKSLVAVKGRRQGWSYKAAAICTHEFYFYPDSKAIIGAFYSTFSQNTMNMVIDNSNFINTNTEFRKQRNPDLKDFIKARYQATVGGVKVWKGFNSEVRAISYKDNPTSGVGLSANWLIMDECFGKGTKILMSDRTIKNIEDITMGDYVLRPDGSFGKVVNTNTGTDDLFKITQSRGIDYVVNSKHKLILEQRAKIKGYNDGIILVTPSEFLDKGKYLKRTTFGIKPIESLVFKKQEILIDPYYLGIWLGDGDKSKTSIVVNTETDIEIKDFIYEHALQNNYKILEGNCSSTEKCKTYTTQFEYYKQNPFLDIFKKENLHYNKHIPNKYLFNTEEIRLQVLAGLIDTDGWVRKVSDTKCTYYLGTSYKNLLEDYVFLIRSLGFEVNCRTRPEKKTKFNNKIINTKESYIIAISGEISKIPVKVKRKKLTNYVQTTKKNLSRIEVESLGIGEYFGITLEAIKETDSWLMLEDFSIVHNCGVFNNVVDAYGYSEPLIKDGSTYTGVALLFGSSGDMDSGSKYFYEMFTNPEKYNMLDFEDPFNPNSRVGFFSSATKGRLGLCLNPESKWFKKPMVDEDGNSNYEAAQHDIDFLRAKAKHGLDPKAIHNITTQFPCTWKEAFLRNKGNVFGSPEMLEWLGHLENTPSLRGQAQKGELFFDEGLVKWRPDNDLIHITDFPLRKDPKSGESFSTNGCAVIWEHPEKYENGEIPNYLYVIGIDPYDQDKSESGSLGSAVVYKRFYRADRTYDIIVAEYTSRPDTAEEFYEVCRKLCIYYNAKALYENQLKGLKVYFEQKNALRYLCEQPGIIKDIVKDSRVQRGYGIHMNRGTNGASGIKDQCELYLKKWLYEEVSGEVEGSKQLRFQTIKSIPILKELIAYDRDINTDRVIALMLCILQTYELHRIHVEELSSITDTSTNYLEKFYQKGLRLNRSNNINTQFNPSTN